MSVTETPIMVKMGDGKKAPRYPRDSADPEGGNLSGRGQISVEVLGMRRCDNQAKKNALNFYRWLSQLGAGEHVQGISEANKFLIARE